MRPFLRRALPLGVAAALALSATACGGANRTADAQSVGQTDATADQTDDASDPAAESDAGDAADDTTATPDGSSTDDITAMSDETTVEADHPEEAAPEAERSACGNPVVSPVAAASVGEHADLVTTDGDVVRFREASGVVVAEHDLADLGQIVDVTAFADVDGALLAVAAVRVEPSANRDLRLQVLRLEDGEVLRFGGTDVVDTEGGLVTLAADTGSQQVAVLVARDATLLHGSPLEGQLAITKGDTTWVVSDGRWTPIAGAIAASWVR